MANLIKMLKFSDKHNNSLKLKVVILLLVLEGKI